MRICRISMVLKAVRLTSGAASDISKLITRSPRTPEELLKRAEVAFLLYREAIFV